jgi:hypothetical protein
MASNPGLKPGFLEAEDAALKMRLSDMPVSDDKNAQRTAQVFFRHPTKETEKIYPYVTIELLDIMHATDRQHSFQDLYYRDGSPETSNLLYYPSELDEADLQAQVVADGYLATSEFTPVNLMYQVTAYTRSAQHDRQLTRLMLRRISPFQGRGWIEIPEDGTIRRLDIMDWRSDDILDGEAGYKKRIFRKVYTMMMNAEIPTADFIATKEALSVEGIINSHTPTLSSDPSHTEGF